MTIEKLTKQLFTALNGNKTHSGVEVRPSQVQKPLTPPNLEYQLTTEVIRQFTANSIQFLQLEQCIPSQNF